MLSTSSIGYLITIVENKTKLISTVEWALATQSTAYFAWLAALPTKGCLKPLQWMKNIES